MNDMAKNIVLWVIIAVVLMTVFNSFTAPKTGAPQISYSKFLEEVDSTISDLREKYGVAA